MNTPRTNAVLEKQPNGGFGLDKGQCIAQWYDHSSQLERELTAEQEKVKRLREAMGNYLLALDQWENTNSAEKRVARMDASMRAILEATK